MLSSIVALIGALMQFYYEFWVIVGGKIIYGASAGVMLTGGALYLGETLPEDKLGSHGFAVNLGITLGLSAILNMGIAVSNDDKDSKSWMLVACIPICVAIANFLLWLTCFRNEPINFCVANAEKSDYKSQAYNGIKKCYHVDDDMDIVYQIFETRQDPDAIKRDPCMLDQSRKSNVNYSDVDLMLEDGELKLPSKKKGEDEGPNSWQVLVDSRYRCATGIAVTLACFNQLSGLNAINFYSSTIFDDVFVGKANAVTIGTSLTGIA